MAANRALGEVLRRKRPLDVALDEASAGLPPRDSGFARAIANETMRRFGQIDDLLRRFVAQPPPPHKAGATLEILLAGICELLFLRVSPHAAADGANRLAAADSKALHFKPLINAALRRIAREGADAMRDQDDLRLNTSDWLWSRWQDSFGEDAARAIAHVHAQIPPLDLALRSRLEALRYFPPPLAGEGKEAEREGSVLQLPGGVIRLSDAGRVEELPGYAEGVFWVQDFAASLPARLLGRIEGRSVIDLCAAPGGKTAQLCSAGARVIAVERDQHRMARLKENLDRLRLSAELVLSDARDFQPPSPVDCVLLDAPCSATGTIRRHPELPWIKSAGDVAACADATGELLETAASMVAPGGLLVFAVCSLEPEEGTEQIAHFLRCHTNFRRMPIMPSDLFDLAQCIDTHGDLRTLPSHFAEMGGVDGFYAARLVRL